MLSSKLTTKDVVHLCKHKQTMELLIVKAWVVLANP